MVSNGKAKIRAEKLKDLIPKIVFPLYDYESQAPYFDYSHGLTKKNFLRFMRLPKELRDRIYAYVAAAWAPQMRYPKNCFQRVGAYNEEPENWFSIARRPNAVPLFEGTFRGKTCVRSFLQRPIYSSISWSKVDARFNQKKGLLDYFKQVEYKNIEELVYTLTKIRGPEIGILDDFLNWFWRNVTIEFKAEHVGDGFYEWFNSASLTVPNYLCKVQHISINFEPTSQRHTRSLRKPLENRQQDPEFRKFCTFVAEKMPTLQTVLLWVSVCVPDLDLIIARHTGQGWVTALRSIPVAIRFEVHLKLNFSGERVSRNDWGTMTGNYTGPKLDDKGKEELLRQGAEDLTRFLMPNSLRCTASA